MRKSLTYLLIIQMIILLFLIGYMLKPKIKNNHLSENITQNKTIEEKTVEVLSLDETDKNIIGYITIEKIGLVKAPIADGVDLKTIGKYVGHFENTSYLEGNVCLCSHNRGSDAAFFEKLKDIVEDDIIIYYTKNEIKKYKVQEIKIISETDFTVLEPTEENKITLITCVENQRENRLCVVGEEIKQETI